jgi:hypothetical protein
MAVAAIGGGRRQLVPDCPFFSGGANTILARFFAWHLLLGQEMQTLWLMETL